ncbi:MAG: peptidylprolyl isomerase [Planctomycetota bacterium]|nr:peptidylprolyl isomerase [Planctomycetota bacterium]
MERIFSMVCTSRRVASALAMFIVSACHAQLTPDRTYYGVDRPIPMTIVLPEGVSGEVSVKLLEAASAKELASAAASPGPVNLATLFESIWNDRSDKVVYAQLVVTSGEGENATSRRIGPAVVLQPMTDRGLASLSGQNPVFRPTGSAYSGLRAYVDQHVVIETSEGDIELRLRPDVAPNTVWNFRHLVGGGFYTDIQFHRVIQDFVIQVGDPTGQGNGGPGYVIDLENSRLPHAFGVLSMARTGDPNTNGSQIFICLTRQRTQALDGKYTAFGEAVGGEDVIRKIGATPVAGDRPTNPPMLKSARLVPAPPYGEGPEALKDAPTQPR